MGFCSECGTDVGTAKFCPNCGAACGGGGAVKKRDSGADKIVQSAGGLYKTSDDKELKETRGANHGPSYGLDAELAAKNAAKYDPKLESDARHFIEVTTGEKVSGTFAAGLADGVLLCKTVNKLKSGAVSNINKGKMAFAKMENIQSFISACQNSFGLRPNDCFMTVDLYEEKNMNAVVNCILALKRAAGK